MIDIELISNIMLGLIFIAIGSLLMYGVIAIPVEIWVWIGLSAVIAVSIIAILVMAALIGAEIRDVEYCWFSLCTSP
jgi:hypothetical protein